MSSECLDINTVGVDLNQIVRDDAEEFKCQQRVVKSMARQQLEVSEDSPFSRDLDHSNQQQQPTSELERLRAGEAQLLREETEEIKRQLELVRNRLAELNATSESQAQRAGDKNDDERQPGADSDGHIVQSNERQESDLAAKRQGKRVFVENQQVTSSDSQFHRNFGSSQNLSDAKREDRLDDVTKLRPLTGKTDCPNCACDRRRRSVCDKCAGFRERPLEQLRRPSFIAPNPEECAPSQPKSCGAPVDHDERPIRPARRSTAQVETEDLGESPAQLKARVEVVDKVVVPNKLFSIGKSLDNKRAKLSQTIEELQTLMEKVKKRGERLEEERKVAQLYREQWRFGPQIGGGSGGGRPRPSYSSRLDPQLARDANSLMGFRHVEPALRLRQYSDSPSSGRQNPTGPPKARPRQSKIAATTLSGTSSNLHARSKSLESLPRPPKRISVRTTAPKKSTVVNHSKPPANDNFQAGRSSSEMNLASTTDRTSGGDESATAAIEEEIEHEIVDLDEGERNRKGESGNEEAHEDGKGGQSQADDKARNGFTSEHKDANNEQEEGRVKRMTWAPVFGETEIKTVQRRAPQRKVAVVAGRGEGATAAAAAATGALTGPSSILRQRSQSALSQLVARGGRASGGGQRDRVMNEAARKLHFAGELLEDERRDSRERNQLRVREQQQRRQRRAELPTRDKSSPGRQPADAGGNFAAANREFSRLEEMIAEQQRLLSRLADQQHRSTGDNDSSAKCNCSHESTARTPAARAESHASCGASSRQLIAHLRERLNRTRLRLARTLETERTRHQRREQSARRKQSDLEHENELLKRSLSKCIDTCLQDIASTFESLSETLADSAASLEPAPQSSSAEATGQPAAHALIENAAQLITDDRRLNKMREHIESIERQRRALFEELTGEKQRAQQLEAELRASRLELARQSGQQQVSSEAATRQSSEPLPSTSKSRPAPPSVESDADESSRALSQEPEPSTLSSGTFASLDLYRQYIESMTPDLDAIRRERRQVLSELDNIKRMLADIDSN